MRPARPPVSSLLPCRALPKKAHQESKDANETAIIPWSLPHTGFAHNQWKGLYGRTDGYGHVATVITVMTPIGKVRAGVGESTLRGSHGARHTTR